MRAHRSFGLAANVLMRALVRARELSGAASVAALLDDAPTALATLLSDTISEEHVDALGERLPGAGRRLVASAALFVAAGAAAVRARVRA